MSLINFSEMEFFYESGEIEMFLPERLEIKSVVEKNEICIKGETLLRRAGDNSLGTLQVEYLIKHQDKISEKWQKYHFPFTGTIYRHKRFRSLWIPYLVFIDYDKEWNMNFHCLHYYFNNEDYFLVKKH